LTPRSLSDAVERTLGRARGAVFTAPAEARLLAALGLAHAAARRGGPPPGEAVAALLGVAEPPRALRGALEGLVVLDPACGAGALLVAADGLARAAGARLRLRGIELSALAARASASRLPAAGDLAAIVTGDALALEWPRCDLLLANPPFLRHEAIPPAEKAAAARRSGLPRRADLSAHFARIAIRSAPVVALVWPLALEVSRSAAALRAEAAARGGMALWLRSRVAGSFAASVETALAVWVEGGAEGPRAETSVAFAELPDGDVAGLARGRGGRRVRMRRTVARAPPPRPSRAVRVGDVCDVRFGVKSGCNAFFHLRPLGGRRYESAIAGVVPLRDDDVVPLLRSLKEAAAPEVADPGRVLFRPGRGSADAPGRTGAGRGPDAPRPEGPVGRERRWAPGLAALGEGARALVAAGVAAGIHLRPTCASRDPWWLLAPGRGPAPVLYPAKVGARAFAFHNTAGYLEDKKWHALFPRGLEPWMLALVLSSTPVRLAVDRAARQLTGAQAIADIDCAVLAGAPFPSPDALARLAGPLRRLHDALARDPVTTDLPAMLDRAPQRELDGIAGAAMGLSPAAVERDRRELLERIRERMERGSRVREAIRTRA
jgi:hypothetical protein